MDKLNTWWRIGIVVTVLWVGFSTFATAGRARSEVLEQGRSAYIKTCLTAIEGPNAHPATVAEFDAEMSIINRCRAAASTQQFEAPDEGPLLLAALGYAAINTAALWALIGGVVWVIGWIRRGQVTA